MDVGQGFKVEILFRGICNQHGLARLRCPTSHALPDLDSQSVGNLRRISHVEPEIQFLSLLIQQENCKIS